MSDDGLASTFATVASIARAAEQAYRPIPQEVQTTDQSGAVSLTLEDHGRRVDRVVLAADWQDKISPDGVGAAVLDAVLSVQLGPTREVLQAVATTATDTSNQEADTSTRPSESGSRAESESESESEAEAEAEAGSRTVPGTSPDWDALGQMLSTLERALDVVMASQPPDDEGEESAEAADQVVGQAANGKVEVTLTGGSPSDVTVDSAWAARASRQKLSDALTAAFAAAHAEADQRAATASSSHEGLAGELQSIMDRVGLVLPQEPTSDGR